MEFWLFIGGLFTFFWMAVLGIDVSRTARGVKDMNKLLHRLVELAEDQGHNQQVLLRKREQAEPSPVGVRYQPGAVPHRRRGTM
jgi:hypothetical protein